MATVTFSLYSKAFANILGGEISGDTFAVDYLSDTIKCALTTSTHTPNLNTHETYADLTNEVVGTGYVAGGQTLTTKTVTATVADSWTVQRANTTVYAVGDLVRPAAANTFLYICAVAGTSGGGLPTYSTVLNRETSDGTVTWSTVGSAAVLLDCDDPTWTSSTITARNCHIYKDTGTPSTSPLLAVGIFSGDVVSTGGSFIITIPSLGFAAQVRQ